MNIIHKFLSLSIIILLLTSCVSYHIKGAGDLTMAATRNIEQSKDYVLLKTYAGISKTDIEAAKTANKKGKIKKKNPIIKEVNAFKSDNLQGAIDNVVKSVPGGEYLKNLRVYVLLTGGFKVNGIGKGFTMDYIATGDVWGEVIENPEIKGFHKDDNIVFTYTKDLMKIIGKHNFKGVIGKQYNGKVLILKGGGASIQLENGTVIDVPYSSLTNLGK